MHWENIFLLVAKINISRRHTYICFLGKAIKKSPPGNCASRQSPYCGENIVSFLASENPLYSNRSVINVCCNIQNMRKYWRYFLKQCRMMQVLGNCLILNERLRQPRRSNPIQDRYLNFP